MPNLNQLTELFGLNQPVSYLNTPNPQNFTIFLADGTQICVTRPAPAPAPVEVIAYFGYPNRDVPSFYESRRVVMLNGTHARYICGLDLDDNRQYKKFLRRKMVEFRTSI